LLHGENVAKFALMTASVTDLRRKTSDLIDAVKRGESVEIVNHGKPVARMDPSLKPTPIAEFVSLLKQFGPDPDTADAIETEIKKARTERRHADLD
jgi:antitoxin (DNA-binding transcriptional repressor) of toxin-antitoxin stability system